MCRDVLWFISDNFTTSSYRNNFKKKAGPHAKDQYIKTHYDYTVFCNSRFASPNTNMIAHLQNMLTAGLNQIKDGILPKYVLVVLDDDLITYLNFKNDSATTLLGMWVEWIAKEFNVLLEKCKSQIPPRCCRGIVMP